MGLLDFLSTDEGRLGLGLLGAAGPRSDGAGFGQRMQEAFAGQDAYKKRQADVEFRKVQMEQVRALTAKQQQATAREQQMRDLAQRFQMPGQQGLPPLQGDPSTGILPSAGQPAVPAGFNRQGYGAALEAIDPTKGLAYQQAIQKENQINKLDPKDYTPASIAKFSMTRNYADLQSRDKLHFGDTGGAIKGINEYTGQEVSSIDKTQSPDNFATTTERARSSNQTNQLGWANYGLAKTKAERDADNALSESGGPSQSAFTKQFGKPSAGFRWKTDGSQEFIPGGPADQKAQMKTVGEGSVDSVIADIRDKFDVLSQGGGVTDTNNGLLGNLGAGIASSGVGQAVGRYSGTQNQSARNSIAMTRPLLLQSIMRATGMSARQMDSNVELKLYLSTATDPTLDLQANRAALDRLEKLYGSGGKGAEKPQVSSVGNNTPAGNSNLMQTLPTANSSNRNKTAVDHDTGKRYRSNGLQWVEQQ